MISEEVEYQLSQYLDGSLGADESRNLETRAARDPDLAAMLVELRGLDALLKSASPSPRIRWKELADHISNEVIRTG